MKVGISKIAGPACPTDGEGKYHDDSLRSFRDSMLAMIDRYDVKKASGHTTTIPDDQDSFASPDSGSQEIVPPFDFGTLAAIVESSSTLSSNIDAMVTNIDGFGYMLDPIVNFNNPDINEQIRDIMLRQRIDENESFSDLMTADAKAAVETLDPSLEEIEKTKSLWKRISSVEKSRARSFFDFVNPLMSFVELRRKTRRELEMFGNAAWEIIREDPSDVSSKIVQIHMVPFINVRLRTVDPKPQNSSMVIKKDQVLFDTVDVMRYFRSYVRETMSTKTYYKEFGDPRVLSRVTGNFYDSIDQLSAEEEFEGPPPIANELYHWKIDSPLYQYGVPRWIGALLPVLGSRAAEEVNFLYFDNKAIPPMIMLVSGGRLTESSVSKIETHINERIKGRDSFHNIMVIEGVPASVDPSEGDVEYHGKMKIELKPLVNESIKDGLFLDYDKQNQEKIGRAFRQSPILTGDTKDLNRSTSKTAKALAEEQVYQPERDVFDAWVDRYLMTNIRIHFWSFKTKASVQRIPTELVDNISKSLRAGAITPNEARRILSDAFSVDLDYRPEQWAETPPVLAEASARTGNDISANPQSLMTSDIQQEAIDGVVDRLQDQLPDILV